MRQAFRFAHFSDPHLPLGGPARLRALLGKRFFGYLSWYRARHKVHRPEVLATLLADVAAHGPDHIVVTGDLINISLPDEFERARAWLERVGPPDRVSLVPGNHDATVTVPWDIGLGRWQPWMTGDDPGAALPFVRVRGPVAFVGVSTALPTAPLLATGRVGAEQAMRLEEVLRDLARRDLFRIVLMHHPPLRVGRSERKALTDRKRVQEALARAGAELVLHGHHHREHVAYLAGPDGVAIPVVGVPSASAAPGGHGRGGHGQAARWIQFTVERPEAGRWRLAALVRGYDSGGFRTESRFAVAYGGGSGLSAAADTLD